MRFSFALQLETDTTLTSCRTFVCISNFGFITNLKQREKNIEIGFRVLELRLPQKGACNLRDFLNLEFSFSFPGFSFSGLDLVFKSNFQTWDSLHISIQSNLSGGSVHIALHRNTYLSTYIHNNYGIWLLFANYKQLM